MKTLSKLLTAPDGVALLIFAIFYIIATFSIRNISSRDPGSIFFDPRNAYEPRYSIVRQLQAERYIETASDAPPFESNAHTNWHSNRLCVGIPSIARQNAQYLRTTVGSLLDNLSAEERDGIHLIILIAHTDPWVHPAYTEPWLVNLADDVLLYNGSESQLDHLVTLEHERNFREKGLVDYTYLLEACHASGSPYIAMLEDDVVAMDGWYQRTLAGIQQAEKKTARLKGDDHARDFLYLRLFYTEEFLGWNREEWPLYLFWSLVFVLGSIVGLSWLSSTAPSTKKVLHPAFIVIVGTVCMPLLIGLFFAAGRVTSLPLPTGVNLMNNYGCCSQGLVYPREKALDLISWYRKSRIGFVDMLTEQYANKYDEQRWALTPSVIQHVGRRSSKGDDFESDMSKNQMAVAERLWNFAFEMNDESKLRRQHDLVQVTQQDNLAIF